MVSGFFIIHFCYFSTGGTFTKVLQYIIVEFTPSIILLYAPSPNFWNNFKRSHFSIRIPIIEYYGVSFETGCNDKEFHIN
jgi:hypothetical protein